MDLPRGSETAVKFDSETRTFTVYANNLNAAGSLSKTYTVTVTGTIGGTLSESATFELEFQNPCPNAGPITETPLPSGLKYTLFSSPHDDGFSFVHEPF